MILATTEEGRAFAEDSMKLLIIKTLLLPCMVRISILSML
jgi:hypothetical protein